MKDEQIIDWLHIKIHALRLIQGYSASMFEQELNKLIAEEFSNDCLECKEKVQQLKYQPVQENKKSFWGGLFGK